MNIEQQIGRYSRLKDELVVAYSSLPWNMGRIERLNHDLAAANSRSGLCALPLNA